jgi:uncharacterized cupin superfamily protein
MSIEVIDLVDLAHKEKRRKNVFNTPRFHAWMHYYKPGHKDEMHCHNADQTFYVIDGECTMRFPDGGEAVLKPGQARAHHRGVVLSTGKHGFGSDDHDGQPLRAGGEDPDHRLCNAQGRPRKSSG